MPGCITNATFWCPGNTACKDRVPDGCLEGVQMTPFAEVMFLDSNVTGGASICKSNNDPKSLCERFGSKGAGYKGALYISSGVGGECTDDCNVVLKSLQVGIGGDPSSGHKVIAEVI